MIIDTHHHFWHYTEEEFGWIPDEMSPIRRNFLPTDLLPHLTAHQIPATIAIQARQSEEETRWLLGLAAQHNFVAAVVGWLPLRAPDIAAKLAEFAHPKLRGVRHVLQAEHDIFMQQKEFNAGLALLEQHNLVYELLILECQFPAAIALVDRHPNLQFVLDHLGKPNLGCPDPLAWSTHLHNLASRPNVVCKISGGITEADLHWTPAKLTPYFNHALDAFGPDRLMFGSNWPVCEAAGGYDKWLATIQQWAALLSPSEQHDFFTATAQRIYRIV